MFLLAQEKSDTIEFLKSELVQLLYNMRQEIAASRQSQTGAACHHIEYCMDKIQRAKRIFSRINGGNSNPSQSSELSGASGPKRSR